MSAEREAVLATTVTLLAAELARCPEADRDRALCLLESLSEIGSTTVRPAARIAADALAKEMRLGTLEIPEAFGEEEPEVAVLVAAEGIAA